MTQISKRDYTDIDYPLNTFIIHHSQKRLDNFFKNVIPD